MMLIMMKDYMKRECAQKSYASNLMNAMLDVEKKKDILEKLFQKRIDIMAIEPNFYCDYGYNIYLSKNFYSNHNLVILDANKVEFGENVFIGPNCGFYTSGHPLDYATRNKGLEYAKPN